jgi:hypothetical protein
MCNWASWWVVLYCVFDCISCNQCQINARTNALVLLELRKSLRERGDLHWFNEQAGK